MGVFDFVRNGVREMMIARPDLKLPAFCQVHIARNRLTVHPCSVSTSQIAKLPDTPVEENFTVVPAADFIGNDQAIGCRATNRRDLSGIQWNDGSIEQTAAND